MASSHAQRSSSVYLVDYFIYCPSFGRKEGQEERKILYYYPSTASLDRQIRTVGYCEGLVQFTETFALDQPCESVHFQKTRLLFYKAEHDICLAMTLHVPVLEQRKENRCLTEYHGERINDRLMSPILRMSYRYFVLQHGTILAFIAQSGVEDLRTVLKGYFDKFIEYHMHKMIRNATIDSVYVGIQFLSVEKRIYLHFQTMLRRLELRFTSMKETLLIYRDQLVWSGLDQDDTALIYAFFRLYYWPHLRTLLNTSTIRYVIVDFSADRGNELILSSTIVSQKFFLGQSSLPHRILAVHVNAFTCFCIFHHDAILSNHEQVSAALELFQTALQTVWPSFDEFLRRKNPMADNAVRHVYFNKINMAYSAASDWNKGTSDTIANLTDTLAEDLQWFHPAGQLLVKRENDPWILAKRSDMRELLVIVNEKSANLKEISDKIKQIFSTQFSSVLLLE